MMPREFTPAAHLLRQSHRKAPLIALVYERYRLAREVYEQEPKESGLRRHLCFFTLPLRRREKGVASS
jgi:hypothetical protein